MPFEKCGKRIRSEVSKAKKNKKFDEVEEIRDTPNKNFPIVVSS